MDTLVPAALVVTEGAEPASVTPAPQHRQRKRHWVIVRSLFGGIWKSVLWDPARRTWSLGRADVSPTEAARRGWDYAGPALSPRDLEEDKAAKVTTGPVAP